MGRKKLESDILPTPVAESIPDQGEGWQAVDVNLEALALVLQTVANCQVSHGKKFLVAQRDGGIEMVVFNADGKHWHWYRGDKSGPVRTMKELLEMSLRKAA